MIDKYQSILFYPDGFWFYHCNGKITTHVSKKDGKTRKRKNMDQERLKQAVAG
jgi:hypothetical protein